MFFFGFKVFVVDVISFRVIFISLVLFLFSLFLIIVIRRWIIVYKFRFIWYR